MDTPARRRLPRIDPRVFDAVVAVALFLSLVGNFGKTPSPGQQPVDLWAWVLAALMSVPYAVHRRLPWPALAVGVGALVAFSLLHYAPYPGLPVFVLLLGISLHGSRRDSVVALAAVTAGFLVALLAQPVDVAKAEDWYASLLSIAVAWLAGDNVRERRLRWASMEERARMLEREREERDRAAVAAERLRIARELHDIVAHSMSVVAVQAGVGKHVIEADRAAARDALAVIESTSRGALIEMRRMLGVLREGDEAAVMGPMPGISDIPRLVADVRRTGLGVMLESDCMDLDLPAGVDLAAYRVVQEALTNVMRHGGPVATVRLTCGDGHVAVEVTDEGRPAGAAALTPGSGHGLAGMRERVTLYGGGLETGPRPGGGFRVHATLPYAAGPA